MLAHIAIAVLSKLCTETDDVFSDVALFCESDLYYCKNLLTFKYVKKILWQYIQ